MENLTCNYTYLGIVMFNIKQNFVRLIKPLSRDFLNSADPVSRDFGFSRGTPIDRYYIDEHIKKYKKYITGNVIEIGDNLYTRQFGKNIKNSDILTYDNKTQAQNLIIGDLTKYNTLPPSKYDCFVCTQTLNFTYEVGKAIEGASHILKPGGYFLGTVAGLTQISEYDMKRWGDYWRFTHKSLQKLLINNFEDIEVVTFGNALSATALIQGLCTEDLPVKKLLDKKDPAYEVLIGFFAKNSKL